MCLRIGGCNGTYPPTRGRCLWFIRPPRELPSSWRSAWYSAMYLCWDSSHAPLATYLFWKAECMYSASPHTTFILIKVNKIILRHECRYRPFCLFMIFLSLQVGEDLKYMWGLVGWFFRKRKDNCALAFCYLKQFHCCFVFYLPTSKKSTIIASKSIFFPKHNILKVLLIH